MGGVASLSVSLFLVRRAPPRSLLRERPVHTAAGPALQRGPLSSAPLYPDGPPDPWQGLCLAASSVLKLQVLLLFCQGAFAVVVVGEHEGARQVQTPSHARRGCLVEVVQGSREAGQSAGDRPAGPGAFLQNCFEPSLNAL